MAALASLDPAPRKWPTCPVIRPRSPGTSASCSTHGWSLGSLRGFDLFPMTEHVELVGILEPPGQSATDPAGRRRWPAGGGISVTRPFSERLVLSARARSSSGRRCHCRSGEHRLFRRLDLGHDWRPSHHPGAPSRRQHPSAIAKQVCQQEAQADIASALGEKATVSDPTWVDHLYSCHYGYPTGSMALSVKELSSWAQTLAYFKSLGVQLGNARSLANLGQGAFQTTNGSVVVRKDWKVLWSTSPDSPLSSACRRPARGTLPSPWATSSSGAGPATDRRLRLTGAANRWPGIGRRHGPTASDRQLTGWEITNATGVPPKTAATWKSHRPGMMTTKSVKCPVLTLSWRSTAGGCRRCRPSPGGRRRPAGPGCR